MKSSMQKAREAGLNYQTYFVFAHRRAGRLPLDALKSALAAFYATLGMLEDDLQEALQVTDNSERAWLESEFRMAQTFIEDITA